MLQKLTIQNYAIIEHSEIQFTDHLNIITGETGAGKSILMGALALILGERADGAQRLQKDKKMVIEAIFDIQSGSALEQYIDEQEWDHDGELLIRREIGVNGKGRAFINDTPVTIQQLQWVGAQLVDLHQQFDTLNISQTGFQVAILDALAKQQGLFQEYQTLQQKWVASTEKLHALKESQIQIKKESDYIQFLFQELEDAAFQPGEIEQIEQDLKLLDSSDQIKSGLDRIQYEFLESPSALTVLMKQQIQSLSPFKEALPALSEWIDRLQATYIETTELARDAQRLSNQLDSDPATQQRLQERLNLGYRLLKKHQAANTQALLDIHYTLSQQLLSSEALDQEIEAAERVVQETQRLALEKAKQLSSARKQVIPDFEKSVQRLLKQVGMANAVLKVSIESTHTLSSFGIDEIDFLFDANQSGQLAPVRKVASGGELSRLMLCIKSLVARHMHMPTLIFDEIDTGISGEAAKQAGKILKELGQTHQLICITHQPQIAGKADTHFYVYKAPKDGKINTQIKLLTQEERIQTIARMMSGDKPSAAALENARELIEHA